MLDLQQYSPTNTCVVLMLIIGARVQLNKVEQTGLWSSPVLA